jgi:hypothetical protein
VRSADGTPDLGAYSDYRRRAQRSSLDGSRAANPES